MVTVAAPSYLARHGTPQHPQELMQAPHRCVHYFMSSGKHGPFDFQRGEEKLSLMPPGALAVNDSNAYWDACVAGLGIGQLPEPVAHGLVAGETFHREMPRQHPLHIAIEDGLAPAEGEGGDGGEA